MTALAQAPSRESRDSIVDSGMEDGPQDPEAASGPTPVPVACTRNAPDDSEGKQWSITSTNANSKRTTS
jgi:hypothetical protein